MYYIVEFLNEKTVAVVPDSWMLTLESCLWPPQTLEWKNKRARLVKARSKPEECFETYNIKFLGSSVSLKRANQKAKKAVDTSDINTTDAHTSKTNLGRPKRKRKRSKVAYSSSESSDDVSSEEEETNSSYIPPPKPPASQEVNSQHVKEQTKTTPTLQFSFPSEVGLESAQEVQSSVSCVLETPRRMGTPIQSLGRPVTLEDEDTSGFGVKALLRLNAEFHKQILRKLKLIETELAAQREILARLDCGSSQQQPHLLPELPFDLPMTSEDTLRAVEDFLKTKANQDILIRHLKLVGGAELDSAVRGILRRCMTNSLASTFSYNGLREKRNFKSLILKKVVFSSVQLLFPSVTEVEFAKIVGDWFRYAPRKKGGSKQRGRAEHTFRNTNDEDADFP